MQDLFDDMIARVTRHTSGAKPKTALPRLGIGVMQAHEVPETRLCSTGVCLVLQGSKQMQVGGQLFRYGAGDCFGAMVEVPTSRYRIETAGDRPYVATSLEIDRSMLADLIAELPPGAGAEQAPGFGVATASRELLEAWDHYLALLDTPADLPILAAQRERELLYRLLQSPHGPMLRQAVREDTHLARIRRVIDWIKQHFDEALPTSRLAEIAGMSIPSLHRHFRAATTMSPLQFQKMLRLQAARNLLATDADATRAAYAVGYESPSQFGREYARLFGRPPARDATYLRSNPVPVASSAL